MKFQNFAFMFLMPTRRAGLKNTSYPLQTNYAHLKVCMVDDNLTILSILVKRSPIGGMAVKKQPVCKRCARCLFQSDLSIIPLLIAH